MSLDVNDPVLPSAPITIPDRSNYTSDEVSAAVEKLVQESIRRPYGILGERRTGDTFDDTMDAAAGVFILTPSAPFYVILLGVKRLNDVVTSVISSASDLLNAVTSTGRRVRPVTNITSLGNARAALLALEQASAARDGAFQDIEVAPAFQRFDRHTDRFLTEAASSIRVGGTIAQTPQGARKSLGNLVSALTGEFQDIQRRVRLLEVGIDNYNSLNLPALLAQGVISKAREVLEERISQLEELSPTARLEFLRGTVLDVLAGKAVVRGFGSLTKSGEFVTLDGIGTTYSDSEHPGKPAIVSSTKLDPYIILTGADQLTFTIDSGPTVSIPLQKSFVAKLEGTAQEPFLITLSTNDNFKVLISGASNVLAPLTAGSRTAAQIVADINASITTQPIVAETFLAPEKFIGTVTATGATGTDVDFQKTGGSWNSLNVELGDAVIVQDGSMAQVYLIITGKSGTTISCTISGPGTTVNGTGILVSVGPPGRYIRVRIEDGAESAALAISRSLTVDLDTNGSAAVTLGFAPGMQIFSRRTRAEDVALSINSSTTANVAGVNRVSASVVYVGGDQMAGRTEPTDPTRVISSLYRGTATVTGAGATATFAIAGALSAGVVVGNVLTIRSAPAAAQVGLHGIITAVSDSSVTATMSSPVVLAAGLELEFGLNLNAARDQVIRILAPSPLAGDYRVLVDEVNPTESTLDRPFPLFYGLGARPLTFQMQVGAYRVDFASTSLRTDSQLVVEGTAGTQFFTTVPVENIGSTRFVLFEEDPKVLTFGDRFELYTGQYAEPEYSFGIIGFELGQKLIEVDGDIPNSFIEFDFSQAITTPFARIRKLQRNNYDLFKADLGPWLALPLNQDRYFSDLNRFLNPLIVNENPTLSAVNTAKIHVQTLIQGLQQLQIILSSYEVEAVPQVDTLVDSFLSRGSDRAVDTLLEARFTEFFGYNNEEMSYLGNALERLRDVSRLDLPVRRKQRKEVIEQELTLGEYEDPDFEFDQSDTRDVDEIDIPGSFIEVPGSNF